MNLIFLFFQKRDIKTGFAGLMVLLSMACSERTIPFTKEKILASSLNKLGLDCVEEKSEENKELSKSLYPDSQYNLLIPSSCSHFVDSTETTTNLAPLDIVFVLDITGSMQTNIDTVKTEIHSFMTGLTSKGWDARFAAVGFRDHNDEVVTTSFMTGTALQEELSLSVDDGGKWYADGGGDAPEAGQLGIQTGANILKASARANAIKVILFVTDVLAYSLSNKHNNFEVNILINVLKSLDLGPLKFYCSAESDPSVQCNEIRAGAALKGKNLSYPLSADVFNSEFIPEFETITRQIEMSCYDLETSVVSLLSHQEIGKIKRPLNSSLATTKDSQLSIAITDVNFEESKTLPLRITTKRCCSKDFITCEETLTRVKEVQLVKDLEL